MPTVIAGRHQVAIVSGAVRRRGDGIRAAMGYPRGMERAFTVVLSPDPAGGYSVSCPAMPGANSQGETREETLANIVEAMEGWYEVALERGFGPLEETVELIGDHISRILGFRAEFG